MDRLTAVVDRDASVIARLGVLAVEITSQNARMAPILRLPSGVMVIDHTREAADGANAGLTTGDTIRSINGAAVGSVDQVRAILGTLARQSPIVLQIERNGRLMFLGFELD